MTVWSSAARSSVSFTVPARGSHAYGVGLYNVGVWPGPSSQMSVTMGAAARTAIVFGAEAPPQRLMAGAALTSVVFSASGELTFTWADFAPCEPGIWTLTSLPTGPANDPGLVI